MASSDGELMCYRGETNAALSHFAFYAGLGYAFPGWFWFWQALGIVWEALELYVHNRQWLLHYTGGCVHKNLIGKEKLNAVDSLFGIKTAGNHVWQPSVSDIAFNLVGFALGRWIYLATGAGRRVSVRAQ